MRITVIAAGCSIGVSLVLMLTKFFLYFLTGSSAILADALESIINVVASSIALASVLIAAKPADESHPYGHGKIEFFSAGIEGALIVVAAIGIFVTAIPRIIHPAELAHMSSGLLLLFGTGLVNLALGFGLFSVGMRMNSMTLIADGRHVMTDFFTSAGVFVGLLLVKLTGWYRLDGIVACLAACYILLTGWRLVSLAFSRLMDASDPKFLSAIVALVVENRSNTWINIHRLRAWQAGEYAHVDFHLVLPFYLTLRQVHREMDLLEGLVAGHFQGQASVLIHTDPCDPVLDCGICRQEECPGRMTEHVADEIWTLKFLTRQDYGKDEAERLESEPD